MARRTVVKGGEGLRHSGGSRDREPSSDDLVFDDI